MLPPIVVVVVMVAVVVVVIVVVGVAVISYNNTMFNGPFSRVSWYQKTSLTPCLCAII